MPRARERGNSLLLALIVMSALATLGTLTVVSVQSSLKASTNDRSQAVAMYAAESGAALAVDYLRANYDPVAGWSAYVTQSNAAPVVLGPTSTPAMPSSGALPATPNNPFSIDQNAWFSVTILNNRDDLKFALAPPNDGDGRVVLQVTGHGPQGSTAIIEWDIQRMKGPVTAECPPLPVPVPSSCALPWGRPPPAVTDPVVLVGWHVVNL